MTVSTAAGRRDPGREGADDSPARSQARVRTHHYISGVREAARSWPGWESLPASRRQVLEALLAEAQSRGWREFPCSERYLVTLVIRHRHTGPADQAGRQPPPISAATCHRALTDLNDAGWLTLSREGCKIARRPRRWQITHPPAAPAPRTTRPDNTGSPPSLESRQLPLPTTATTHPARRPRPAAAGTAVTGITCSG